MSEHVEFRDLKYIAAVAEAGNFTRAAEGLYVAQPSLSKQIKDVEVWTTQMELSRNGNMSFVSQERSP